jgi:hypothetical protein
VRVVWAAREEDCVDSSRSSMVNRVERHLLSDPRSRSVIDTSNRSTDLLRVHPPGAQHQTNASTRLHWGRILRFDLDATDSSTARRMRCADDNRLDAAGVPV